MKNPVTFLRYVALIEATSFVVLLGAMVVKYSMHQPSAVRIPGIVHGALFLVFCFALLRAMTLANWNWRRAALVFVSTTFVPFGPFFMEPKMKIYEAEFEK